MEDEIRSDVENQTDERHSWIVEIEEKFSNMESTPKKKSSEKRKNTIHTIPPAFRRNFSQDDDYTPRKVSFGPYHHGDDSCTQTEQIKERAILYSLKRNNKTIRDYADALNEVVQDLKGAYDELDPNWQQNNDAFLKLMVYDRCFALEVVNEAHDWFKAIHRRVRNNDYDYSNPRELMECYKRDMLLLENQIPMLVLEKLVAVQMEKPEEEAKEHLHGHIQEFVHPSVRKIPKKRECLHVLDLHRHSLLFEELKAISTSRMLFKKESLSCLDCRRVQTSVLFCPLILVIMLVVGIYLLIKFLIGRLFQARLLSDFHFSIPSAMELDNVGIGFTMSKTKSLMDISFGRRSLRLPQISVDGTTSSKFLNIIAFEQVHEEAKNKVTSYIYFMSRLLQSADDVSLLKSRGIIHGPLVVNEVAELFNSLAKDIVHDPKIFLHDKYRSVVDRLTKSFYHKMNNPWQKDLSQNYLRSPLAIVSLIAAFILFSLTTIQTVYTVLSYYHH